MDWCLGVGWKYVVYQAYELDEKGKRTGKIYTGRTSGDDDMSVDQILKKDIQITIEILSL